jgi:adhesin/invasin
MKYFTVSSAVRARLALLSTAVSFALLAITACSDSTTGVTAASSVTAQAGNLQTGVVGTTLANPVEVFVANASGTGLSGITVTWTAGTASGSPSIGAVVTDANGMAQVNWTLGTTIGSQTMTATVAGITAVTFTSTATAGAVTQILKAGGDAQSVTAGITLPTNPAVNVFDQYGNPVVNATVTWQVIAGGGSLNNGTTTTDASGQAQVMWTIGAGSNSLTVTVGALAPITFTATGL